MSSVFGGCLTILFLLEVNVIRFIMDYMSYRDQLFSGHCNDDLHFVFLPDLSLVIGNRLKKQLFFLLAPHAHWMMFFRR